MTTEKLNQEITDAMKALFDLTGRIDERVKMLIETNDKIYTLINRLEERATNASEKSALMSEKVAAMEIKFAELKSDTHAFRLDMKTDVKSEFDSIQTDLSEYYDSKSDLERRFAIIEKSDNQQENRWKIAIGYVIQTIWVVVVCYLLYKLNLQTPPIP